MRTKTMLAIRRCTALLTLAWRVMLTHMRAATAGGERERGDVPGWVMITLMSAVLVAGLLAAATPALEGLFDSAIQQVQQP